MAANRGLVGGVVAAVVAAIAGGWFYSRTLPPEAAPVASPVAEPVLEPSSEQVAAPASGSSEIVEAPVTAAAVPEAVVPEAEVTEVTPPIAPPSLSVVRVTENGGALVSGTGLAGAAITVRVDGATVAQAATDGAGQFVAMFDLGFSEAAQLLTLEMVTALGEVILGGDSVILVPRPALVVAQAQTAAPELPNAAEAVAEGSDAPVVAELAPVASEAVESAAAQVSTAEAPTELAVNTPVAPPSEAPAVAPAEAQVAASAPERQAVEAIAARSETPAPQNFILRDSGEVVVLNSAPQALQSVVVDAISYDAAGDLVISGRARPDQGDNRVQLYLDNRPVALATPTNGGWAADLPQVDPGVYALRVDEIDAGGQVISRFETPFQREEPQVVASAQALASPPATPGAETPRAALITVQPGHTLWHISAAHYGEGIRYVQVFNANRAQIRNPDLIFPGQVFVLPED